MVMKIVGVFVVLLIVGMAIPAARVQIFEAVSPVTDAVRSKMVPSKLEGMADQLEIKIRTKGPLRPGEEAWAQWLRTGYSGTPEDPWGNLYFVNIGRRGGFTVGSVGPDEELGTEDDITLTRTPSR
jgi:Type II secretion system (T2SS), protein G